MGKSSVFKVCSLIIIIISLSFFNLGAKKIKEKDLIKNLSLKYREWLKLTKHIISDIEKKNFLLCAIDRDRDAFINMFWKMRDPTPGTRENEYKTEHIKRYNYANKYYKYGAGRPGNLTDMGMIHIILGEPLSKHKYDFDKAVVPVEIWTYSGDKRVGLPGQ